MSKELIEEQIKLHSLMVDQLHKSHTASGMSVAPANCKDKRTFWDNPENCPRMFLRKTA
jgi:hypothetical protein